ncbi:MAG TPA: hypothetical protein VFT16_00050 [Candidatus Saccharimonadales bacterium]|nr:hypothetical protein [Candidatus Saccharimonadales bacterium]
MTATRSRDEEKRYKSYLRTLPKDICVFCTGHNEELIEKTASFKVIRNIFGYSIWDGQKVADHLMITPKKHTDTIATFTRTMFAEFHELLSKYEAEGYNIYARAPASAVKSIAHHHTHLIKTEGAPKRFVLLSRKPYLRITAD